MPLPGASESMLGVNLATFFSSRINHGQMLVTFADSHSALSVLDVDGMKVSVIGFLCFHWVGSVAEMRQEVRRWSPPFQHLVLESLVRVSTVQPWLLAGLGRRSKLWSAAGPA